VQQRLPKAVFERINVHLRALYTNTNDETCETCIARNLSAAARTCKNWRDGLVPVMYVFSEQCSADIDMV